MCPRPSQHLILSPCSAVCAGGSRRPTVLMVAKGPTALSRRATAHGGQRPQSKRVLKPPAGVGVHRRPSILPRLQDCSPSFAKSRCVGSNPTRGSFSLPDTYHTHEFDDVNANNPRNKSQPAPFLDTLHIIVVSSCSQALPACRSM